MRVGCSVLQTQGRPVPQGRVLQCHVGFHPNNRLTWLEFPVEHSLPEHKVVLWALRTTRTGGLCHSVFFEVLSAASTNIPKSLLEHHLSMAMVFINAIGSDDHAVGFPSGEPFRFLLDGLIGFQHGWLDFRVGVVKPQDELAIVHFSVGAVDDKTSGVSKRKRTVRVWSKTEDDLSFLRVLEFGQTFPSRLGFPLLQEMRRFRLEQVANRFDSLLSRHGVGCVDLRRHKSGHGLAVLAQITPHGHDAADDRTHRRLALILKGVLKGHMTNQGFCFHIGLPRHVAQQRQGAALQEMRDALWLEEPLLRCTLNTSYRHVAFAMLSPKTLYGRPPPTHLGVDAALFHQRWQRLLRCRVGWIAGTDIESHTRRHCLYPTVSFFLGKNARHAHHRMSLVGFVFRNHGGLGIRPAIKPCRDSLRESLCVHVAGIGDDGQVAFIGNLLKCFLKTLNLEPIQALLLQGLVNPLGLDDDGCTKPSLLVALLSEPCFDVLALFGREAFGILDADVHQQRLRIVRYGTDADDKGSENRSTPRFVDADQHELASELQVVDSRWMSALVRWEWNRRRGRRYQGLIGRERR